MGAERDALYFHRFSVFAWTGENYSNTLSVDAYFGENGGKIKKYPDICGRGLNPSTVPHCVQPPCPSNKLGELTQLGLRQRKEDGKPCQYDKRDNNCLTKFTTKLHLSLNSSFC